MTPITSPSFMNGMIQNRRIDATIHVQKVLTRKLSNGTKLWFYTFVESMNESTIIKVTSNKSLSLWEGCKNIPIEMEVKNKVRDHVKYVRGYNVKVKGLK